eukprot:m.8702 g.8702  ORF g.8702 m.8702 type:complete len:97 (+) comp20773_c1_seq2:288-578(+)
MAAATAAFVGSTTKKKAVVGSSDIKVTSPHVASITHFLPLKAPFTYLQGMGFLSPSRPLSQRRSRASKGDPDTRAYTAIVILFRFRRTSDCAMDSS